MNTDDLEIEEYYSRREEKNNEFVECYCWLIVVTLILAAFVGIGMAIMYIAGKIL